jgi:hypothetical protein
MAEAVFIDGKPAKVTIHDFRRRHLQSFPKLRGEEYDNMISGAIDQVYSVFFGVATLWDLHQDTQVWYDKTVTCYLLLTAWYIADKYPGLAASVPVIDGIRQKKVDGVSLAFDTGWIQGGITGGYQDVLAALRSNHFGRTALMMIQSAAKRGMLRNRRFV